MKKTVIIYSILFLFAFSISNSVYSQSNRQRNKAYNKEFKKKKKEFKKEGYKLSGSSRSIDVALIEHYDKLKESDKNRELEVTVENCPTEHLCKTKALANALTLYATLSSNYVRGRINSSEGYDAVLEDDENAIDQFFEGFEILVQQDCSQLFNNTSFAVIKKTGNTYKYKVFYIYNEDEAAKLREDAAERALKKVEMGIEWSDRIHDFINEGFESEE